MEAILYFFSSFSSFSKKGQCLRPCTAFQRRIAKIGPSSNESLRHGEFAIIKFGSGTCCPHLEKCISFYLVAYYSQRSFLSKIQNHISEKTRRKIILLSCKKNCQNTILGVVEFPSIILIQFFKVVVFPSNV